MSHKQPLIIFDTTMRDGEQSPGASMTLEEKVTLGRSLENLGVDVIEAGFAAASPGDFAAIQAVSKVVKDSRICSLSRAVAADIEAAAKAIAPANAGRIHTFIATSPIHMQYKLKLTPDQVVEQAVKAVTTARNLVDDVEFSCEDAGRSDIEFLCRIIEAAIDAGATTINIPDTVGYAIPEEFGQTFKTLINRIPNSDKAIFSAHCHNDLGLAVANSLAAVQNGARQVECTINGLGERAGNTSLEEIVMAVKTRGDLFPVESRINTQHIVPTSKMVSSITAFPVQPNKAIVGANAFAHEAGIHQDGVLKHRETYEIMRAEDVGWSANKMVMGKHSGRSAFKSRMAALGFDFETDTSLNEAFKRFKNLADKKHDIFDEDLVALMAGTEDRMARQFFRLVSMNAQVCSGSKPSAEVVIEVSDQELIGKAEGDGAVDAAFKAIETVAQSQATLQLYTVNAVTEGTDSQGGVNVRLEKGGRVVNGRGTDTDVVTASVKAYLDALNLLKDEIDVTSLLQGESAAV